MLARVIAALLFALAIPRAHADPAPPVDPTLDALDALRVDNEAPWRAELYSWTTDKGAADLRAGGVLLIATATSGKMISPFNRLLADLATHPGPAQAFAQLLSTHPILCYRRYAWPSPMATVMGLGDHGYGHTLIGIRLRPEALIARLDPDAAEPVVFFDAHQERVAAAEVLADPRRLAAVLHVRAHAKVPFREYVIVNETMVESWEIGTSDLRYVLEAESALLHDLEARAVAPRPAWLGQWSAVMAFGNDAYEPRPFRLRAIERELGRADLADPPRIQVVTARWP